jgi:hypothetical protein
MEDVDIPEGWKLHQTIFLGLVKGQGAPDIPQVLYVLVPEEVKVSRPRKPKA